jgi:hypothetical protein
MAVTQSIEITPSRYIHLVHIKFNKGIFMCL